LKIFGFFILIAGMASGCGNTVVTPESSPVPPTSQEPSPTITETVYSTPEPTPTEQISLTPTPMLRERPWYQLSAVLDYPNKRVTVEERILIPNPAEEVLTGIDLVVPANNWRGAFSIQEIKAGGLTLTEYELSGPRLTLNLGESGWQPDQNLELEISFTLNIPKQNDRPGYGPSPFGYTDLQTNLIDWYPMVPPYQDGVGWAINQPWIFGEYLVYPVADFDVSLEVETPGLVVAASAAPTKEGNPYQYSMSEARNFVLSISPAYQVLEEEVQGINVYGYYFPTYQVAGKALFEATIQALTLYQDLYGPYQDSTLSVVQADFYHGMEYEGLFFQSRGFFDTYSGSVESYLVAIGVHETAHQWWYGQVGNDQALEPWLDEALCTFSELAFYENLYPESVDWWWNTRVNYYEPEGRIDRSIYGHQEYVDQYLSYRNATYLQGAKFLAALKNQLGDEAFYRFLTDYGDQYKNKIATSEDFFALLDEYIDLEQLTWLGEYFLVD
jgi:hypothetical protein